VCPRHERFVRVGDLDKREGVLRTWTCDFCGAVLRPYLVPPVLSKAGDVPPPIRLMWRLALRELLAASKTAVVGVSFAPSDFELRWLIRQSAELRRRRPPPELVVVNRDEVAWDVARGLFDPECPFQGFNSLDEYLNRG
jgi:hypothetical protein